MRNVGKMQTKLKWVNLKVQGLTHHPGSVLSRTTLKNLCYQTISYFDYFYEPTVG